jgi:hypothetical protein
MEERKRAEWHLMNSPYFLPAAEPCSYGPVTAGHALQLLVPAPSMRLRGWCDSSTNRAGHPTTAHGNLCIGQDGSEADFSSLPDCDISLPSRDYIPICSLPLCSGNDVLGYMSLLGSPWISESRSSHLPPLALYLPIAMCLLRPVLGSLKRFPMDN